MAEDSTARPPECRWWGWGDAGRRAGLPPGALEMLRSELGEAQPTPRVERDAVVLPAARPLPPAIGEIAGPGRVLTGDDERLLRSAGKGYPDLVRARAGHPAGAPDAVVVAADAASVARLLEACTDEGVAVVPFGGGTSVVGGVDPVAGAHERVIALDLRELRRVATDPVSLTATLGAGLRGPEVERRLGAAGLTLGHFPQSFEYATVGGFAATRSAGQASSGYGRFDELVTSLTMSTPAGELRTGASPHTAAGPSLRELALGSEGTLGVICEVTARVRPRPEERIHEGWMAGDFESGAATVRELAQCDALPDVIRVSDESETRVTLGLSGLAGIRRSLFEAYLRLRGRASGCLVICGWEGGREAVRRRRAVAASILRGAGAVPLGAAPGRAWERGRFEGPYLRDELLDLGYMVETLETSHTWSALGATYHEVGRALVSALGAAGTPGIVLCHVSHAYRDGASLYFTFICRARPGAEVEHWRGIKGAACEAIVGAGATITHHHAIGRDHAPYMGAEVGETGLAALAALKRELDPAGIMNPGKLIGG